MKNVSTRLLLTCAAIGVSGGLVFIGSSYIDILIASTLPIIYGVLIGVYFIPGVIAQTLLRRGGVAILTGLIAGLTSAAFTPQLAPVYIGTGVGIGALQEIPFLIGRYRYWKAWVFYAAAGAAGLLMGGGVMIAMGFVHHQGWFAVIYFGAFVVSPVIGTWLGRLVGKNLDRTGVARGVQHEIVRTAERKRDSTVTMAAV